MLFDLKQYRQTLKPLWELKRWRNAHQVHRNKGFIERFWPIIALMTIFAFKGCNSPAWAYTHILTYNGLYHKEAISYYTDNQYVNAIFWAEGGYNAKYLYGIRSVKYANKEQARRICLQTIQNNQRRFKNYGFRKYSSYLQFLASRYCPTKSRNLSKSEIKLNRYWQSNVLWYLKHPKEINNG